MTLELNELLPVDTPLGSGFVWLVDSDKHDNYYTVILDTGAIVTFPQSKIRASRDYTRGRALSDKQMKKIVS